MKKEKMNKEETEISFQEQKIDLIRLRIQNGFYDSNNVLENVVKSIMNNEIKR
jgi:anti-sigma28 factor (negative regulator of flagellin synthesis)